jgi:hypothetical protein
VWCFGKTFLLVFFPQHNIFINFCYKYTINVFGKKCASRIFCQIHSTLARAAGVSKHQDM